MSNDNEKRKPTQVAELLFSRAANTTFPGYAGSKGGIDPKDLAMVLHDIAAGLEQMAIGLRATYMLLEKVDSKLQRL